MTEFYLNPAHFDKWVYQNDASYTGDFVEGVLLDSFVMETRRGYAFFYEHGLNCWSSDYCVIFVPDKNREESNAQWDKWYEFTERACA